MLFNSARHSMRYYYPYFCRWGNWSAELWSNLFKITLLLSGRSGILTWVWLTEVTMWPFSKLFHEVKKIYMNVSDFFLLNILVIILNHVIISLWKIVCPRVPDLPMDRFFIFEVKSKQHIPTSFLFDVTLLDDECQSVQLSCLVNSTYFLWLNLF